MDLFRRASKVERLPSRPIAPRRHPERDGAAHAHDLEETSPFESPILGHADSLPGSCASAADALGMPSTRVTNAAKYRPLPGARPSGLRRRENRLFEVRTVSLPASGVAPVLFVEEHRHYKAVVDVTPFSAPPLPRRLSDPVPLTGLRPAPWRPSDLSRCAGLIKGRGHRIRSMALSGILPMV